MKTPRTLSDLRNDPRVSDVHNEGKEDGYWLYLDNQYIDMGFDTFNPTRTIHEWTVGKLCDRMNGVIKATS